MSEESGEAGSRGGAPGRASGGERVRTDAAVIALRMEDITVWVIERVAKMPRDHKFTVGDKLVETCLEVTTLLVEASFTRDRLVLLGAASRALTRARVLVRVAQRLGLLSSAQREHFARESLEVGKMLGGWTRATRVR